MEFPLCNDSPSNWNDSNGPTYNCAWYAARAKRCTLYGNLFRNDNKVANEACCACGGGNRNDDNSGNRDYGFSHHSVLPLSTCSTTFAGSYGSGKNDGTHDQDYSRELGGGVVVGPGSTITMFGNAWKAYRLCNPYEIRKSSVLKFDFVITDEVEGHAICLDEGKNHVSDFKMYVYHSTSHHFDFFRFERGYFWRKSQKMYHVGRKASR